MIQFRIIGEDAALMVADMVQLAEDFGVRLSEVSLDHRGATIIGTATGRLAPKESVA